MVVKNKIMEMTKYHSIIICCVIFASACNPTLVKTKSGSTEIEEDLAIERKAYLSKITGDSSAKASDNIEIKIIPDLYEDMTPTEDLGAEMDSILAIMENEKKDQSYVKGYTIQVFSGTNRDEVRYAIDKVYATIDGLTPRKHYYQPNYQVTVGSYYRQIDALEDFAILSESFKNALIIPFKIAVEQK